MKLDTMTGQIWLIYSIDNMTKTIDIDTNIKCDGDLNGRFTLCFWQAVLKTPPDKTYYPIHTIDMVLLDQNDGRCWLISIHNYQVPKNIETEVIRIC